MSSVGELVAPRALRQNRANAFQAPGKQASSRSAAKPSNLPDDLARDVYCVLGIPIDVVDMAEALRRIDLAAAASIPYVISTPNLNFLTSSRSDAEFRETIVQSDLCPPDGMPIIWIARVMGLPIRQRVAGSDIFDSLKKRFSARPMKTFLFGGGAGIAALVERSLNVRPLGLSCVGSFYPGFGTVDLMSTDEILDTINASRADFLAVALNASKGQTWLHRNHSRLQIPIRAQLGAALNFQAGTLKRAPNSFRKLGLEWLWRIKEEPYLWRRYADDGMSLLKLVFARVLPIVVMQQWQRLVKGVGTGDLRIDQSQSGDAVTLRMSGCLTMRHADKAAAYFRKVLGTNKTIALDLSMADTIDARFLGLLLMVRKAAAAQGSRLIITRVSRYAKRLFHLNGAEFLLS